MFLEGEPQGEGAHDDEPDRHPCSPLRAEAEELEVLAEEPGDRGRHRDDRSPRGDLLHDEVHPVALQRHICLKHVRDLIAQGFRPVSGVQGVVVDVCEVRLQLRRHELGVAANERRHHLAQRDGRVPHPGDRAPEPERATLEVDHVAVFFKELARELFGDVVEAVERCNVVVDEHIEERPEDERHTMLGEVVVVGDALFYPLDGELIVPNRDDESRHDEGGETGERHFAFAFVDVRLRHGEEHVRVVAHDLWPLVLREGILNSELVEIELAGELFDHRGIFVCEIKPSPTVAVRVAHEGGKLGRAHGGALEVAVSKDASRLHAITVRPTGDIRR